MSNTHQLQQTVHLTWVCNYGILLISTEKSDVQITLDASRSIFLAPDTLLVSLKGGELYLFHFLSDARNVRKIVATKAGSSVLVSCVSFFHSLYC